MPRVAPIAGESRAAPPSPMTDPANDHWTGGQYSLCRASLGMALAAWAGSKALHAASWSPAAVGIAAMAAGIFLALGAFDRIAAAAILFAGLYFARRGLAGPEAGAIAIAGILLIHLTQPAAPHGSLAAAGRVDPDGGWRPRRGTSSAAWIVLAAAQVAAALAGEFAGGLVAMWPLLLGLFAAVAALAPGSRGAAIAAMAATHLAGLARGGGPEDAAFLIALPFALDPRWFGSGRPAPAAAARHDLVLYDGDCGLCHRAVRFLLAEDRSGVRFRFAPLGGAEAMRRLGDAAAAHALPDSIVIQADDPSGRLFLKSGAVLRALDRLGGLWRVVAFAGRAVPRPLGDALYDAVARARRRIFPAPKSACPLIPPALRARFILDSDAPGGTAQGGAATGSRPGGTPSPGSPGGSPPLPQSPP